ncbi:MAG: DnaJ C-terminal domain-containing protein, partial [Nitrospinota bacterium]|nr:DnaJ C-terminal domain-containing protein [Nitrospinota bacterium]
RRLTFEFHPDRHAGRPEMEARFEEIVEAYEALRSEASDGDSHHPGEPPRRGRDLHYDIRLDFLEAAAGGEVSVQIERPFVCPGCGGGEGAVVRAIIPSGIEDGEEVRVPAEGAPGGAGGRPGDLFLKMTSARHPALERRGLNVHSEVRVPRFRLVDGGTVRVFTVRGAAHVEIPPKTRPGRTFRLKGWGISRRRSGRTVTGDHVVPILEMPAKPPKAPGRR